MAAIGNFYYPDDRNFKGTVQRMGTQIGTDAISGVLKEFWPDIKRKFLTKQAAWLFFSHMHSCLPRRHFISTLVFGYRLTDATVRTSA